MIFIIAIVLRKKGYTKEAKILIGISVVGALLAIFIRTSYGLTFKGELNEDEVINYKDVRLLQEHLVQVKLLPEEVMWKADMNSDGVITVTDLSLLIQKIEEKLEYTVKIQSMVENYFPNKNEEIELKFSAIVSPNAFIEQVTVNGENYKVNYDSDKNEYTVKVSVGAKAGIQEFKFTEAKLNVGEKVKIDFTEKVDVLKTTPIIENYRMNEILEESKVKISFDVVDVDKAIIDGKVEFLQITSEEEITLVDERSINSGKNELEFEVSEDVEYLLNICVSYNLDTDTLGDKDKENDGSFIETKSININMDYGLNFQNLKTLNEDEVETIKFHKNEPIIVEFESSNNSTLSIKEVSINGEIYPVTQSGQYYRTIIKGIANVGDYEIKVDSVILENGKQFTIEKDNVVKVQVQKELPSLESVVVEQVDVENIRVSLSIKDLDKALLKGKVVIKNEGNEIIGSKDLNEMTFDEEFNLGEDFSSAYTVEVIVDYDVTTDNSAPEVGQVLYSESIKAQPRVKASLVGVGKEQVEKNQGITLTYKIESNQKKKIHQLVVNNVACIPEEIETNTYKVHILAGDKAGILPVILTQVIFEDEAKANTSVETTIEVLKDTPEVGDYQINDGKDENKVLIDFQVIDPDKAFISGKAQLAEADGTIVAEQTIKVDENHIEFEVEENKLYKLKVDVTYKRDEVGEITYEKVLFENDVLLVRDYKLTIDNIETLGKKYFNPNEKIQVSFRSTNSTKFIPVKVQINGDEYPLTAMAENDYSTEIKGFEASGVQTINIEKIWLDNGKELDVSNGHSKKIEILKVAPSITEVTYEELDNGQVQINFEVVDLDQALTGGKIIVFDGSQIIYQKEELARGHNEVTFDLNSKENYTLKVLANYDLDSNALDEESNTYEDVEIYNNEILILQKLIEFKNIQSVQLFRKNGEKVEEVFDVDVKDFDPSQYIAKVTMKEMPVLYAKIASGKVTDDNKFNLILEYDNAVEYENGKKSKDIEVTFGNVIEDVASNITFERLVELISKDSNAQITLTSDLDAKFLSSSSATYLENFTGTINGNGHVIRNLSKPLFNNLSDAQIENLVIEDANLNSSGQGILANVATGTKVSNVHIINSHITMLNDKGTGGFFGIANNSTLIEKSSFQNGKVKGNKRVGGFAGYYNNSTIDYSYVEGIVEASNDAIGGLVGEVNGDLTIQNSYAQVQMNVNVSWAIGGLVGYANRGVVLQNNISLALGTQGYRVMGNNNINNSSTNNYEITESTLTSNVSGSKVKAVSKAEITEEFMKTTMGWNSEIYRLEGASGEEMPTLKNRDPKDRDNVVEEVTPDRDDVYIPEIERLKGMESYEAKKEIAYHNMNKLIPFYDAKYIVEYGNQIDEGHILNQSKIKLIIPYNENNEVMVGLYNDNYNQISKIKVVFENEEVKEYTLEFDKLINAVSTYTINDLGIGYTYNKFILNKDISAVSQIVEKVKELDYATEIATVTTEEESRLYVDYYNESVKDKMPDVILEILANEPEYTIYLDDHLLTEKILGDLLTNQQLEKIIYSYNYFDKWYHMEMGGTPVTDLIFTMVNNLNSDMSINSLVKSTINEPEKSRQTQNTITFFNNVIKKELDKKNIGEFLEYFLKVLDNQEDGNVWFEENFEGILREVPVKDKEEYKYRAWDLLNKRSELLLPILTAPQKDMYIITAPSQILFGSLNRYPNYINGNMDAMLKVIDQYSERIGNFFTVSSSFINNSVNILNNKVHIQFDTRFGFPGSGDQNKGETQDPVIKWVYEALGAFAAKSSNGAYATGSNVFWVGWQQLNNSSGEWNYYLFEHETTHNMDGSYFYEGNGRRNGTGPEDHADGNISSHGQYGDTITFNLAGDKSLDADVSNNLTMDRIIGRDNLESYYREMFETFYVLDYLTAQAFLSLTPQQQSKLAVQVSYNNGEDLETGGATTIYSSLSEEDFTNMELKDMADLWDNGIAFRGTGTVPGSGQYGYDNINNIYWYQPHNNTGRPDNHTFKRLGFELIGVGGYEDGYMTYRSVKSKNDLDALQKATKDEDITWREYKLARYEKVAENLKSIPYFDVAEIIEAYKEAMVKDAENGNRNNTNSLRRLLYGVVKRATKDFSTGTIYEANETTKISSAEELKEEILNNPWGNYELTRDIDFSHIEPDNGVYINKNFLGRIDGNNYRITGLSHGLFTKITFGEIQDVVIESPEYIGTTQSALAQSGKSVLISNVTIENSNINVNFINKQEGLVYISKNSEITIRNNEIKTLDDLLAIGTSDDPLARKKSYQLVDNIDVEQVASGNAIIPGTFEGKIYGNGFKLSNLKTPLFENLNGQIYDLNIENVTIEKVGGVNLGAVASKSTGAIISGVTLNNVKISGKDNLGSVVGTSDKTTFQGISSTDIDIVGERYYAGGLVGRSFNSRIADVLVSGALQIKGTHNGGLVGALNGDTIQRVYVNVDVTRVGISNERNQNGGLYGEMEKGPITVKDVVVTGNIRATEGAPGKENLFKITAANTEGERTNIGKYLTNIYEKETSEGLSVANDFENINVVNEQSLNTEDFYINSLNWSKDIWDLSDVSTGGLPKIIQNIRGGSY